MNLVAPPAQLLFNSSGPGRKFISKSDIEHHAKDLAKAKQNALLVLKYFLKASLFLHVPSTGLPGRRQPHAHCKQEAQAWMCKIHSLTPPPLSISMNEKGEVSGGGGALSPLLPLSPLFKALWIFFSL